MNDESSPRRRHAPPPRQKKPMGARKHITPEEHKKLRAAAGSIGRYRHRDSLMVLMAFIHGFRATELVNLLWEQINLAEETVHVTRIKHGTDGTHPLSQEELVLLRRLARKAGDFPYVFRAEGGKKMGTRGYAEIVARAGKIAGLPMRVGTHMLRHGCGFYWANKGFDTRSLQGYLGHKNITNTVIYTELAKDRFKVFKFE